MGIYNEKSCGIFGNIYWKCTGNIGGILWIKQMCIYIYIIVHI